MAALKIATMLTASAGPAAVSAAARDFEAAGVDVICVPEAYGADAVSLLGYLAGRTERVELMSGILPIYSRTPALTAMTAAGLDLLSGGRFRLGLGVSGPLVVEGWHGVPYDAPLARTQEIVDICRKVWRREHLRYEGSRYRLPLPGGIGRPLKLTERPLRATIPIHVAALGPSNVELAARSAEGWNPFLYIPELADRVWGEALVRGLARRPVELGPLQIVAGGPFAVGDDVTHLRELDRDHLTQYVGGMGAPGRNFYNRVVERYGFAEEARQIQALYLAGRRDEAAALLPDELLAGTSLIGSEAYLRDRLRAYLDRGVTMLQVQPVGADPLADLRRLRVLVDSL